MGTYRQLGRLTRGPGWLAIVFRLRSLCEYIAEARSTVSRLLWFRAFNRRTASEVVSVLRHGDTPATSASVTTATRRNELQLGIDPPSVYAYLGQILETFGRNALVVTLDGVRGEMCPFDSGGLVDYLEPVRGWQQDDRRAYLKNLSFPTAEETARVEQYPTLSEAPLRNYLDGAQPAVNGPHVLWGGTPADLWKSNSHWRAWTWEGRVPGVLPTGNNLRHWTCPPDIYAEIELIAESSPGSDEQWFSDILPKYVRGGVSHLLADLKEVQVAS